MPTVFTKIAEGEIPSYKVAENEDFYAFLDINPMAAGHTLVIPKHVEDDYIFSLDSDTYMGLCAFARKVALAIGKAIPCKRVGVAVLGMEVPHTHIHLVPLNSEADMDFRKRNWKCLRKNLPGRHRQFITNMSKSIRIIFFAAAASVAAACTSGARIDGAVESAPSSEVVVKLLDANRYSVLDTVKTDASGKFSYKVDVKKGQPEFVYLFFGDRRIASLLLENGDKVKVAADTLGNYAVEGSEESSRLAKVEKDYSAASAGLVTLPQGLRLRQERRRQWNLRVRWGANMLLITANV